MMWQRQPSSTDNICCSRSYGLKIHVVPSKHGCHMLRAYQLRDTNNIVRSHPTVVIALFGSNVSEQLISSREELPVQVSQF